MEAENEPYEGVSGRTLQKRLACTMGEKVRETDPGPFRGVFGRRLQ